MSNPYVGEIRMFGGNFAPAGWAFCDGALLAIAEFETLFNLIGTTYGGAPATGSMAADSLSIAGASQPHDNMLPFLAVSFIISLFGIFPSQT